MAAVSIERHLEEVLQQTTEQVEAGAWTLDEAARLLQRRRTWECALARTKGGNSMRDRLRDTFVSYIRFEVAVWALLRRRLSKREPAPSAERSSSMVPTTRVQRAQRLKLLGKMRQRIIRLYERAVSTRLLRAEDTLWFAFIRFVARTGEQRTARPVLVRALRQIGPSCPRVFVVVASLEVDLFGSTHTARAIFLRGLRHHDQDTELWAHYIIFEVTMALKRLHRMAILQASERGATDSEIWKVARLARRYAQTTLTKAAARKQLDERLMKLLENVAETWREDVGVFMYAIGMNALSFEAYKLA
ncbi:hypothetical protein F1559_000591 [Cyanidiococcus yangmingshanensis]|uniref:U3 small nucleolar RNA-associated protein 6 N-terminal domain-containing protein n=1 Tax=Cyanidiococcus yangmingshanensis TaxID=2690220 RepID=A0A7J7IDQ0_9RHOD|nr:hypothetical protein F1559_000591 [Cyanidiococcus yangmingshanensis]